MKQQANPYPPPKPCRQYNVMPNRLVLGKSDRICNNSSFAKKYEWKIALSPPYCRLKGDRSFSATGRQVRDRLPKMLPE